MMHFEEFIDEIRKEVAGLMGSEYDVITRKVPKNNGIVLTGLMIGKKGSRITPAIYLDSLYEAYMHRYGNMCLKIMAQSVVDTYRTHEHEGERFYGSLEGIADYGRVKDKIVYKLINTEANRELLKQVPSIPFQDLSIVFMLYIEESDEGICTALIHNEHVDCWNVTQDDLYRDARENTPRLLPETLTRISEVLQALEDELMDGDSLDIHMKQPELDTCPFYILTNRIRIESAACLLYPDVMKKYADRLASDLLIIPSSIHETLLLPYDGTVDIQEFRSMVQHINDSEVPAEDQLSEQVYLYGRSENRIMIAA